MGEFWEKILEAHFDVDIQRKHYLISIDESLMSNLLEIAMLKQVAVEILIDAWLSRKGFVSD